MTLAVNLDHVVSEVTEVFHAYEVALVANDAMTLNDMFWNSAHVVRFGVDDVQMGHREVARWRTTQSPIPSGRRLADTRVVAFGEDLAVVTTTFRYPGRKAIGRQSQTWVRMSEGWRIVSAHVSEIPS